MTLSYTFLSLLLGRSLTYCELQREINTASSNDFIPRCKDNGDFEPLQCHLKLGECWCVDESGIELPDSRTAGVPDCSDINGNLVFFIINKW